MHLHSSNVIWFGGGLLIAEHGTSIDGRLKSTTTIFHFLYMATLLVDSLVRWFVVLL